MDEQQPAATSTPLPNVGGSGAERVEREPTPEKEVEAMAARGFGLTDGAYRPRTRQRILV